MPEPPAIVKDYGPWAALFAAAVAILQSNAVIPSRGGDAKEVAAIAARLDDHNTRIRAQFDAIGDLRQRTNTLERSVDLLTLRQDDNRSDVTEMKGQLSTVASLLGELKTDMAVMGGEISALADRAGVNRPPVGAR